MWAGSSGGAPLVAHTWVRASEKPYLAVTVSVCVGQARIKQMSNSDVRLADAVDILLAAWVLGHAEWRQFPVIGGLALRRARGSRPFRNEVLFTEARGEAPRSVVR
jgi:hypothetical protein